MSNGVVRIGRRGKAVESAAVQGREGRAANLPELDTRVELIQALIPSGLAAADETVVHRVYHLDRGYDRIEAKLAACGADIERLRE